MMTDEAYSESSLKAITKLLLLMPYIQGMKLSCWMHLMHFLRFPFRQKRKDYSSSVFMKAPVKMQADARS